MGEHDARGGRRPRRSPRAQPARPAPAARRRASRPRGGPCRARSRARARRCRTCSRAARPAGRSPGAAARSRATASAGVSGRRRGSAGTRRVRPGSPPGRRAARDDGGRGRLVGRRAHVAVELGDHLAAGGERLDRRRGRHLALHEHVVVAERRVPRRVEPGRRERPLRRGGQAGVARGVVVGPVVVRVRVAGLLHAVVARRAAVGSARPPRSTASARSSSLAWALSTRSPVTATACGRSASSARTAASSTWADSASCGRKVGLERRAEAVQERHARGRLLVAHVGVGELAEARDLAAGAPAAAEVAALGERRAGPRSRKPSPSGSTSVARSVEPGAGAGGRLASPQPAASSASAASGGAAARITPPAARRRPARAARAGRRARSRPAVSASSPSTTIATWPGAGASGSDAKPAASRATSGPSTAHSSSTPASAAGSATAAAAPASTVATARASPPQARSSATAPRRSRAVIVSACTSA